jgi:hypothetical protein
VLEFRETDVFTRQITSDDEYSQLQGVLIVKRTRATSSRERLEAAKLVKEELR